MGVGNQSMGDLTMITNQARLIVILIFILHFTGCGGVRTILSNGNTLCSSPVGAPFTMMLDTFDSSATRHTSMQAGNLLGGIASDSPDESGGQATCDLSSAGYCAKIYVNHSVQGSYPANTRLTGAMTGDGVLFARYLDNVTGDGIILRLDTDGTLLRLYVPVTSGLAPVATCQQGVTSTTSCPSSIYGNGPRSVSMTITGCSPNIQVGVKIDGVTVPGLTWSGAGPDEGSPGFAVEGKNGNSVTPSIDGFRVEANP